MARVEDWQWFLLGMGAGALAVVTLEAVILVAAPEIISSILAATGKEAARKTLEKILGELK